MQPPFIDSSHCVTAPLVGLLNLTGIAIKGEPLHSTAIQPVLYVESRGVTDVMEAVQGKKDPHITWLRPFNKERWQHDHLPYLAANQLNHRCIIELGQKLLNAREDYSVASHRVLPQKISYNGVLLLGTTLHNFFSRVKYLKSFYNPSSHGPITVLTGSRLLDPKNGENYEEWEKLTKYNQATEEKFKFSTASTEMIQLVLGHFDLPYQLCIAPIGPGRNRATTQDTVDQWLQQDPIPGRYLAISGQPFIVYQHLVIWYSLQQYTQNSLSLYTIDVAGPGIGKEYPSNYIGMSGPQKALILLDTLARILYNAHMLGNEIIKK